MVHTPAKLATVQAEHFLSADVVQHKNGFIETVLNLELNGSQR